MPNQRIYYAVQQVGIKADGTNYVFDHTGVDGDGIHGVQSLGMTTNFNLEQVFELGQLAIYENIEDLPDVEVTMSKVLDGYPLIYHHATKGTGGGAAATGPTLANRSNVHTIFGLAIFPDTQDSASGDYTSAMICSGMYVSSLAYNFSVDGFFTEDVTIVGNNKIWQNTTAPGGEPLNTKVTSINIAFTGVFPNNDDSPPGDGGVNTKENLDFTNATASDKTILPPEVFGIASDGTHDINDATRARLQSISVSADLGRENLDELGRRGPYHKYVTFPIEVTCDIEVLSTSGDMISAIEEGIYTTGTDICENLGNLKERAIRIATCEGTRIYLGDNNKLASVNYGGGDAGGGNVTVTYTFTTFNDFTVMHSGEENINSNASTWWTNRADYLTG
jgi:hypothetical protein